jgi:hypothetical protein
MTYILVTIPTPLTELNGAALVLYDIRHRSPMPPKPVAIFFSGKLLLPFSHSADEVSMKPLLPRFGVKTTPDSLWDNIHSYCMNPHKVIVQDNNMDPATEANPNGKEFNSPSRINHHQSNLPLVLTWQSCCFCLPHAAPTTYQILSNPIP